MLDARKAQCITTPVSVIYTRADLLLTYVDMLFVVPAHFCYISNAHPSTHLGEMCYAVTKFNVSLYQGIDTTVLLSASLEPIVTCTSR